MRFAVAVKQVPDTMEMSVDENGSLVRAGVPSILNPYDEYALSRVLSMRCEGDEVIVYTMGPPQARQALVRCLEMGADRAFLLTDRDFAGADVWATARTITAFLLRHIPDADVYVFGRQAIDGDTGQVPYEVAAQLGVQQFAYTESLSRTDDGLVAVQDYGDVRRTCYRIAIGLGLYSVGLKGSMTRIVSTTASSGVRRNRKVEITDPAKGAGFIIDELEAVR